MSPRRVPSPARHEPVIPAGMALALLAGSTVIAGVLGGAAVSALLCGHRPALAGPAEVAAIMGRLVQYPGNPAAVWPHDPRPGPAWLFWACTVLVSITWCAGVLIVAHLVDERLTHRRRQEGLAGATDLRRTGLDARSAVRKAKLEFPDLIVQRRHRRGWGRRR